MRVIPREGEEEVAAVVSPLLHLACKAGEASQVHLHRTDTFKESITRKDEKMSNGVPATERDARQDAGDRRTRQPATVGRPDARAYFDPPRRPTGYGFRRGSDGVAVARRTAIEDARMDCRSTILRYTEVRLG